MNDLQFLSSFLDHHRHWLLFATVWLEQMGLPVPAYPSLVVAGAIPSSMSGAGSLFRTLGVAVSACLTADIAWYMAGRRFGSALMRLICQLSMSPDACVVHSASFYSRYGPRALLIAKFLPGAGAMTTLLAGTHGSSLRKFIVYDALGAAIWAGSALSLGYAFQDTVATTITLLKPYALYGLFGLVMCALIFAAVIWRLRRSQKAVVKLVPLAHVSRVRQWQEDRAQ